MLKQALLIFIFNTLLTTPSVYSSANQQNWKGQLPTNIGDETFWSSLVDDLAEHRFYFGTIAAAERILLYFNATTTKENAYRAIRKAIRGGYPFQVHDLFREGDLQPNVQDNFANSYYTYKGIIQEKNGISKWSQAFFKLIDTSKTPEISFYQGIKAYQIKDFDKAIELFTKLLDTDPEYMDRPLRINVARTLARIYFEKEQYEKSLEIYNTFLLKLNPMFPTDWLEAAWNLFYLKKYTQTLSYLYNLEVKSSDSTLLFEKYILRGLIYKQICAEAQLNALHQQFGHIFGKAIHEIKLGEPLTAFPFLKRIKTSNSVEYYRISKILDGLRDESEALIKLKHSGFALQFYGSEMKHLTKTAEFLENDQLSHAAEALIMTEESLSFLQYEVQRAKVDPNKVFANEQNGQTILIRNNENNSDREINIAWKQNGDFWRSEKLNYNALILDQCKK